MIRPMDAPYLVLAIITLISTIPSLFFAAAEMRSRKPTTRVVARYTTARSAALLVLAVVPLFGQNDGWLLAIAAAMIIVQVVDGFIGTARRKPLLVIGPFVAAAANLAALIWFVLAHALPATGQA